MNRSITMIDNPNNIDPPVTTKLQLLPFEKLTWENFEQLCMKLAQEISSVNDCERYGKQGSSQEGIDIFIIDDDGKFDTYQCKKYKEIKTKDLHDIIGEFKKGAFFPKSKTFTICTACELNSTKLQDIFNQYKIELASVGIELIKWDEIQLSSILKNYSHLVFEFFGKYWLKEFIGIDKLSPIYTMSDSELIEKLSSASCELSLINNTFSNLPQSHINRKETAELYEWTVTPLNKKESNICVLVGNAGTGKTIILRDLFEKLKGKDIISLGLKADKVSLNSSNLGNYIFGADVDFDIVIKKLLSTNSLIVMLVDQIDALSQSLSTNRTLINTYISIINRLSQNPRIRIIISCRTFDLNRDAELKQYSKKKIVKLDLLTETEVGVVLYQLSRFNLDHFPKALVELLKTPLHLDLFCRIYSNSIFLNEIKTSSDLYRELWTIKIKDAELKTDLINYKSLKDLLYKLAQRIYKNQGNLSVSTIYFEEYHKEIEYLKSESLIVESKKSESIQFFHQSFYDYTFSRFFVETEGGDIYKFLLSQHQGLFIRSLVKQIIIYLRSVDQKTYSYQLDQILFSDKIRYHLKLLIIEMLAFEDKPTNQELYILKKLTDQRVGLAITFYNCFPSEGWFHLIKENSKNFLIQSLNHENELLKEAVGRFVVFASDFDFDNAYNIFVCTNNDNFKNIHIRWMLYRCINFSDIKIQNIYNELNKSFIQSDRDRYHIFTKALETAPDFVITNLSELFQTNIFPKWECRRNTELGHDSDEREFFQVCEELYKKHPIKSYPLFKEVFLSLAKESTFDSPWNFKVLKIDSAFMDYDPESYDHHKLIEWIVNALNLIAKDNLELSKEELKYYLSSELLICRIIALRFLSDNSSLFKEVILKTLTDKRFIEDCFYDRDLEYWYRKLLSTTYSLYSNEDQNCINSFVLNFNHPKDKYPDASRHKIAFKYPLYLYIGYTQWQIINSIPANEVIKNKDLSKRLNELNRRYPDWDSKNQFPNRRVGMSHACGGIVSKENYKKFTLRNWYNSFIEFNEDKHYHNRPYISLDEHGNAFKEVVSERVEHYHLFVEEIINDPKIHLRYKIKGLEGLCVGKFSIEKIRNLYQILLEQGVYKEDIQRSYIYSFIRFGENFIDNSFLDIRLIEFWKGIALSPFKKREVHYYAGNKEIKEDELFTQGYGTPNAEALTLIVGLSYLDDYCEDIYQYLLDISNKLSIQLKLVVLSELKQDSRFTDEQLLELFLKYSEDSTPEIYHVAATLLNFLFYRFFEQLIPFIQNTIKLEQSAKYLSRYLLYGWFYGYDVSKDLLLTLHKENPTCISETILEACKYYEQIEYRHKCHFILNLYVNNIDKNIRSAFSTGFFSFNATCFNELRPIINEYVNYIDEDRLHSLYFYLFKVVNEYHKECIEIQHVIYDRKTFRYDSELKEPVELFILCYNKEREFNLQNECVEYTMDVFDKLLINSNFKVQIDQIMKDVDNK